MIKLSINQSTCTRCGNCADVCPLRIFQQTQTKSDIDLINIETCIECSQCVAICPTDSVIHSSYPADQVHEVRKDLLPSPESLLELMKKRRSNRAFSKRPIPMEHLDIIAEAANLAPTAKNERQLHYTLITNADMLEKLHKSCIDACDKLAEKLFAKSDTTEKAKGAYFRYISNIYKNGYEIILRGATAVLLIHTEDMKDTADANLAYQNASLMAEALNIAHFYTGYVRVISIYDDESTIQNAIGIKGHILAGMALAIPKVTFKKYADKNDIKITKIL